MPRRRRPSQRSKPHSKPRPVDRKDGQLRRWNTVDDIELDEEDQFHASRDKIMLGQDGEADEDGDEDEVFALRGVSSDEEEEDEAEYAYEAADEDQAGDGMRVDSDTVKSTAKSKSKSKSKRPPSEKSSSDSEEEETWGRSKGAYYSSNAAQLDSEDEEANELEEQEALRLQAKALEGMCDEDFGLEDVVEEQVEPPEATESNPPLTTVPRDKQTILRTLEKEHPETLALARDWEDTVQNLVDAKARVESLKDADTLELGLQHMYYQALLTYATTLAFYLHLRATEKYAGRPDLLRRHPILGRLLTLKEGIHTLENLGIGQDASKDDDDEEEEEEEDLTDQDGDLWSLIKKQGLESGELAELLQDAGLSPIASPSPSPPRPTPKPKRNQTAKKTKKTSAAINDSDPGTHRAARPAFDLQEPDFSRVSRKQSLKHDQKRGAVPAAAVDRDGDVVDAYGEVSALGYHDASDKLARKKSLRFHVSRISSATSRRVNARVNAIGGDDDIPYRERKKEREIRSEKERERKTAKGLLGAGGDDLDDVDVDVDPEIIGEEKRKRKRTDEDAEVEFGGFDGYYDLVKQATATKKARKKAEYEAATARPELEPGSSSGPRSVTRAILKNKGLTPHRSKAVRNPRVKKRQRYEQANKKVASQKAVYKGGIGDVSKYSGEQSGISKVVKSVRL